MSTVSPVPTVEPAEPATAGTVRRVLVFQYSQSGQLDALVDRILAPLREQPGIDVQVQPIRMQREYPFPWPVLRFFDAFPESALMRAQPVLPLAIDDRVRFDLIVLPYQVWFLAPSLPVSSLLQTEAARALLHERPVVTVVACRNMWLCAHDKMQGLLQRCGARLIDNVVFTDRAPLAATFITTPLWMFTGRRDGWFGLPRAGVNEQDMHEARRFGVALAEALRAGGDIGDGPLLSGLGAVDPDPRLLPSERAGTRSFELWGRLIEKAGKPGAKRRLPLVACYVVFLLLLIVTVVPLSALVQRLLRPFRAAAEQRIRQHYALPSGTGRERMAAASEAAAVAG